MNPPFPITPASSILFSKSVFCVQDFRQSELEFALRWARPMAEDLTFFFFGGGVGG